VTFAKERRPAYSATFGVKKHGKTQGALHSADCIFVIKAPVRFCRGSNFSAMRVRPTARKRLEASPETVWVNEFEFMRVILP
jgi:hypothetical protein